jgi:hypothetical protein
MQRADKESTAVHVMLNDSEAARRTTNDSTESAARYFAPLNMTTKALLSIVTLAITA